MAESYDPATIRCYHAHVYFDEQSRPTAAALREEIEHRFPAARVGQWRNGPSGPHPMPNYTVEFDLPEFPSLVPWLILNRNGLIIFLHPRTGDEYADHTRNPVWLGESVKLRLDGIDWSTVVAFSRQP